MSEDRLHLLVEAGIALSAELSLDAVLEKLLEHGSALTAASRAAIGVLGAESGLERTLGDGDLLERANERSPQLICASISVRDAPYAKLVLADKRDGSAFAADDEELVSLLAAQAAVAIENARRYESATRWLHQLEALTLGSQARPSRRAPAVRAGVAPTRSRARS